MKIAVYSDIHENFHNLRKALQIMKQEQVEYALCLGDFIHPGIVKEIISFGIRTHAVWGNNDGEQYGITMAANNSEGVFSIAEKSYDTITIENKRVAMIHHPDLAPALAKSGDFAAVFYGHNHQHFSEKVGKCWLANPGELSSHVTGNASFLIWDAETNKIEFFEIKDPVNVKK
jgi:hypothetical protein